MSSSAFKALAQGQMSPGDAANLDFCTLDPETTARAPSEFINQWKDWDRALRLNLAKARGQKLKREAGAAAAGAPDYPAGAVGTAKAAMTMESPLEAEIFLDRARWDAIENFQGISSFTESAMYAYLLKLLLMERRMAFKHEEGLAEYRGLCAAILGEPK
jgi:hypothetical protein